MTLKDKPLLVDFSNLSSDSDSKLIEGDIEIQEELFRKSLRHDSIASESLGLTFEQVLTKAGGFGKQIKHHEI